MLKQTKSPQSKIKQKQPSKHGAHFVVSTSCWSEVDIVSDTPLERTPLPFAGRYSLQPASWLGMMRLCVSPPLSVLGLCLA